MASPQKKHAHAAGDTGKDAFQEDVVTMQAIALGKSAADASGSEDLTAWDMGEPVQRTRSIYESWTTRKRYTLLCLMSFATFLVPFSGECARARAWCARAGVARRGSASVESRQHPPCTRQRASARLAGCGWRLEC